MDAARSSFGRKSLRYVGLSTLLVVASFAENPAAHAAGPAEPAIAGLTRQCVGEPVFGETVCVYEANPAGEQTVVLVHGLGGSVASDWANQIPVLAERNRVLAIDLPGFGTSSRGNQLYSIERYSEVLEFVVGENCKGPVTVVGHSMGGAIALWYAATHPDRVGSVVVADVPGLLHRLTLTKYAAGGWFERVLGGAAGGSGNSFGRVVGKILEDFANPVMDPQDALETPEARQRFLGGDPARIAGLALANTDFSEIIPRVQAPALVIWGESDDVAPMRSARVLAARLPRARLVMLASGHVPMRDQPQQFNDLVLAHMKDPANVTRAVATAHGDAAHSRAASCEDDEEQRVFEGDYDVLRIRNCSSVLIRNSRVRRIDIAASTVEIEDTSIVSEGVAIGLVGAELTMTATDVEGKIAIHAQRSRLDLAGVRIVGKEAAIQSPQRSNVILSLCRIESPFTHGSVHASMKVGPEQPL